MIYQITADSRRQTQNSPRYYVRGNNEKDAKQKFLNIMSGFIIFDVRECSEAEAKYLEATNRITFECHTTVKHIFEIDGKEHLYLTDKEKKILNEAKIICSQIYEETKHNMEIEQTADDIQDKIDLLLYIEGVSSMANEERDKRK